VNTTILKNIYEDLIELSDKEMQNYLWLSNNENKKIISSYTEVMSRLYDDNNFDHFIDKEIPKLTKNKNLIIQLKKLRGLLDSYEQKETDLEIYNDPKWSTIVEQANVVLKLWDIQI
jgi:uncharacterized protein YjcR